MLRPSSHTCPQLLKIVDGTVWTRGWLRLDCRVNISLVLLTRQHQHMPRLPTHTHAHSLHSAIAWDRVFSKSLFTVHIVKNIFKNSNSFLLHVSEFDLRSFLCSESEQLIWKSQGLPSDDLSMENALVILQVRATFQICLFSVTLISVSFYRTSCFLVLFHVFL